MTKDNSNIRRNKAFDSELEFADLFHQIGKILDRKLAGSNNPIIRDSAGMDALFEIRDLLCKQKVIKSFKPTIGMDDVINEDSHST